MYDKKLVESWLKGKKYVLLTGYDNDYKLTGYVDVLPQPMDSLPDEAECLFHMDRYKPLEIRGPERDNVWCELYDSDGKYDLGVLMRTGKLVYLCKFEDIK